MFSVGCTGCDSLYIMLTNQCVIVWYKMGSKSFHTANVVGDGNGKCLQLWLQLGYQCFKFSMLHTPTPIRNNYDTVALLFSFSVFYRNSWQERHTDLQFTSRTTLIYLYHYPDLIPPIEEKKQTWLCCHSAYAELPCGGRSSSLPVVSEMTVPPCRDYCLCRVSATEAAYSMQPFKPFCLYTDSVLQYWN